MRRDLSRVWVCAMFPQIDSLPRAERKPSTIQWDAEVHARQGRPHVRRHIVLAFRRVLKKWIAVANEARKESLEVSADVRVCIFLDQQGRGSVPDMKCNEAAL